MGHTLRRSPNCITKHSLGILKGRGIERMENELRLELKADVKRMNDEWKKQARIIHDRVRQRILMGDPN